MSFLDKIWGLTEGLWGGAKSIVNKISDETNELSGSIWSKGADKPSEDEINFYKQRDAEAAQKQADLTTIPGTPEDQGSEDEINFYKQRAAEAEQKQADLTTIPGTPEDKTDVGKD